MDLKELIEQFKVDDNFIKVKYLEDRIDIYLKMLVYTTQIEDLKKLKNEFLISILDHEVILKIQKNYNSW